MHAERRLGIDEQRKRAARSLAQIALIWRSCRTGDRSGGTQIDLRRRLADVIEPAGGHGQAKRLLEGKEVPDLATLREPTGRLLDWRLAMPAPRLAGSDRGPARWRIR
jgi:hypothetical protein